MQLKLDKIFAMRAALDDKINLLKIFEVKRMTLPLKQSQLTWMVPFG